MKICSKGAKSESLPAVSLLVMDELIEGNHFSQSAYRATPFLTHPAYCRGYHQKGT